VVQRQVTVKNPSGLHARPAAQVVNLCKKFRSRIEIAAGSRRCDAKSMLLLLRCCIKTGETVTITAEGEDEEEAVSRLAAFMDSLQE